MIRLGAEGPTGAWIEHIEHKYSPCPKSLTCRCLQRIEVQLDFKVDFSVEFGAKCGMKF